jgi:hypothetical protein
LLVDLQLLAQPPALPPQHGQLLALLAGQPALARRGGVPLGLARHWRTVVWVGSKSRPTCPIQRSPRWHSPTISAVNRLGNDRGAREALASSHAMSSMMDILPGATP